MNSETADIDMNDPPRLVTIETTSRCNARCVFCPNNALSRDKGSMSTELFEKIIEDCKQFPLYEIEPFLQGDPFSDPQILDRLEYIRGHLPDTRLRLYTNAYGLNERKADRLASIGLDDLTISINTLDSARYEAMMGIPLARTLANVEYLLSDRIRGQLGAQITLRMTCFDDTSLQEQDEFLRFCESRGVESSISGLYNYKGHIYSDLPVPSYGCEHVTRLDILVDGSVTLCCMDHNGEYGWGTARDLSVLELYNHQVARRYRDLHRTGRREEADPCGTCNMFWPLLDGLSPEQEALTRAEFEAYVVKNVPIGRRRPSGSATLGNLHSQQVSIGRRAGGS